MLSTTLQPETHVVSARLDSKLSKLRGAKKLRSGRSSRHVLAERMSESVTLQPCSVPGFFSLWLYVGFQIQGVALGIRLLDPRPQPESLNPKIPAN